MQIEKKFFPAGSGNFDDADFALDQNQWTNMENCRIGSTDFPAGAVGYVEAVGSTTLIASGLPSSQNYTIGSVFDQVRNRLVYFVYNSLGFHQIRVYEIDSQQIYVALYSSQVDPNGLSFSKDYIIHSARVVGGIVYWTDNYNQPRKLNIDRAIKMNYPAYTTSLDAYTSPLVEEIISVIRKPPVYPLTFVKVNQTSPVVINNFIDNNAFQFSWRYYYKDGETSVPSVYSLLAPYNGAADDYNRIDISAPVEEYIEQDVQRVDLLVKFGNENSFFIIKSWDKDIPAEAAEIATHNAGTQVLTYSFYNDLIGEAESEAYSLKPFDSVPLLSEALEVFRNRMALGNNLEGYDTPLTTSLGATAHAGEEGGAVMGIWWEVVYTDLSGPEPIPNQLAYVFRLSNVGSDSGFYAIDWSPYGPPFTDPTIDYSADPTILFIGDSTVDVLNYFYSESFWSVTGLSEISGTNFELTNSPFTTSVIGSRVFKSGGFYKLSVVFYDFADRKCGVTGSLYVSGVPVEQASYQIPDRAYDTTSFTTGLDWSLSNADAINEIPEWATHYSVTITKCLKTRFFLQARTKNTPMLSSMSYVTRDADNAYVFATAAYSAQLVGVGVDITNLQNFGMGYLFQDGDIINIYIDGNSTVFRLKIIDQSGRWLICELQDLGTLNTNTDALFEIYTPYVSFFNEPYYEVAETFAINDPGESNRTYSVLNGTINGDVYLLDRGVTPDDYVTENMSPNDKFYRNWYTDAGRPNFIDRIGQQRKETSISYSNVILPGTKVNGLSTFDALDEKNLPEECGAIKKLQRTSKVQNELGIVVLAICDRETASMYIGETQQYGSAEQTTLTVSTEVIGTINILKGSYGTQNPESVVEYRGNVYWLDVINGKIIQYSLNGLFPISNYNMTRFWKLFCEQYLSLTATQIEDMGSRPFIFTAVDTQHRELLISIPKVSNTPPRGYLPDYPLTVYPFDILDYEAKTIVYKLEVEPNFWQGAYRIPAENFVSAGDKLFSFKDGALYRHNSGTSFCEFYGIQYKPRIMFVSNAVPSQPKAYNSIAIEGNMLPTFVYFYNTQPYVQASDLMDFDFRTREGLFYSSIYRNKIVPTSSGMLTTGLLTAEKMRAIALRVLIEFTSTTTPLQLRFVTINYSLSLGHIT